MRNKRPLALAAAITAASLDQTAAYEIKPRPGSPQYSPALPRGRKGKRKMRHRGMRW